MIKAIVWPKPVDHPYIIKLETVVDGYVFCFPFYPLKKIRYYASPGYLQVLKRSEMVKVKF